MAALRSQRWGCEVGLRSHVSWAVVYRFLFTPSHAAATKRRRQALKRRKNVRSSAPCRSTSPPVLAPVGDLSDAMNLLCWRPMSSVVRAALGPRSRSSSLALIWVVCSNVAAAQPTDEQPVAAAPPVSVEIDCSRVGYADDTELEARARLTLAALEPAVPRRVVLRCDADAAWIVWGDSERLVVAETTWLVEAFLDALERQVQVVKTRATRRREQPPQTPQPARSGPPKPARLFGPGGAGLRWALEPVQATAPAIMGPRLDIAVGVARHLSFIVTEGIRSARGSASARAVHLIDVKLGLAYGAPYDGSPLGLQISGGNDWLYSSAALVSAPSFDLAGRVALYQHKLALWFEVAGIVRGRKLQLLDPGVRMNSPGVMLSLGGFWRAIEPLRDP